MKFTHLHVHSHYSLLDGLPKISELLEYVKELGMDSVALTDHGVMYGAIEFYQKARQMDIKPIIGMEAYVAPDGMLNKRSKVDDKRYHLILLAENNIGYKNLIRLTTKAHLEGFYYKPRIDKELLRKHSDGLIALSACLSGEIALSILSGNIKDAEKTALEYENIFGKGNFYLEISQHPNIEEQKMVTDKLIEISDRTGIPLIATQDVHYLRKEDAKSQDILMAVQTGNKVGEEDRLTLRHDDFSLLPAEKMYKLFKRVKAACENTQKIADRCNLKLKLGEYQLPHFKIPNNKNSDDYLKELCYKGLNYRYQIKNIAAARKNARYSEIFERLEHELNIIKETGFAHYFLIVYDVVNWAKSNGIVVGPGRGSAAGSLVSYILNITNVDPLKYNLLFERFLNPERISMPDIDLDFADTRRDEVIEYVSNKYGRRKVAQIITFGTMAARASIRDTGRALGYSYSFCDQIAKLIPFFATLNSALEDVDELKDIYNNDADAKTLIDSARKLEGVVRHASTHACGVVITKDDLENYTPLQYAPQSDQTIVTQYEMHAIEDLGLLKMDFLGLKNLSIIENTLNLVRRNKGIEINLDNIPLDDKETFKLFQKAQTTGIFQLESQGMKRFLKKLAPSELEDIIAMVSLYRPGPMELIPEYIDRKHGKKQIVYIHPLMKPILENTYGIMVYQEQLMKIATDLAGFTLPEADTLRKAVGKKIHKLLMKQKERMIDGMIRNNIDKDTALRIWNLIPPFARYGFNRSHGACYAMIAYQTAYLKAHWPEEFMAALMTAEKNDVERVSFLIDECRKMNINILPPDINESFEDFTVVKKTDREKTAIRFGLGAVKNAGKNIVTTIVQERQNNGPFKSIVDIIERIHSRDFNKRTFETLIKCGAFDSLGERNQLLLNTEDLLKASREMQKLKANGQVTLFEKSPQIMESFSFKLRDAKPALEHEKLRWEKELLGLYVSSHPLNAHKDILKKNYSTSIKDIISSLTKKEVEICGMINKIQKIITRSGKPMLFVQLEDLTDRIEILVFPSMLEKNPTIWQEEKIIKVKGRLSDRDDNPKFLCNEVSELSIA